MVRRSKGIRVNTRNILRKSPRNRGLQPVTAYLKEFEIGERASIVIDPSSQKGVPHHRYQGKVGTIIDKKGRSYVLRIKLPKSNKDIIVRPEHMKKVRE
ncbi:MAG: 50S ribosomal protein L21e [Thermoplasmatota archaeon]